MIHTATAPQRNVLEIKTSQITATGSLLPLKESVTKTLPFIAMVSQLLRSRLATKESRITVTALQRLRRTLVTRLSPITAMALQ